MVRVSYKAANGRQCGFKRGCPTFNGYDVEVNFFSVSPEFLEITTGNRVVYDRIAKSITDAFKGKATRTDDRLVAMVQAGNKKLQSLAAQRDALAKKIADAHKFAADTKNAALRAFSLQSLTQGQEAFSARSIQDGLLGAVNQVKRFTVQINDLAKRGLRKDRLQQIIGLGPEQGSQLATVLSQSTKDSLKRINALQEQLAKASGTLGNTSADVLFDAGKQAGAGFLAGLQGQRKNIEKLMLDIAKGMQSAIRAALKIKSPSRVFMRIGDMTGAGLQIGFVNRIGALAAASRSAGRAMARAVSTQLAGMPDLSGLGSLAETGPAVPLTRAQRGRQAATAPRLHRPVAGPLGQAAGP